MGYNVDRIFSCAQKLAADSATDPLKSSDFSSGIFLRFLRVSGFLVFLLLLLFLAYERLLAFVEQCRLASVFLTLFAAWGLADDRQDADFRERRAGHEKALDVGPGVRRRDEKAVGADLVGIVGQHAFDDVVVGKFEPYPQSLGAGAGGEGLAGGASGVGKIADKVHGFDLFQVDINDFSGGIEQFQPAFHHKIGGAHVPTDGVAAQLADNHLFAG